MQTANDGNQAQPLPANNLEANAPERRNGPTHHDSLHQSLTQTLESVNKLLAAGNLNEEQRRELQWIGQNAQSGLKYITSPLTSSISNSSQSDLDHTHDNDFDTGAGLRTLLDNMPVMVVAGSTTDMTYALWNREAERVTGYSAEEIIGNPRALELLYPDPAYRKQVAEAWARHRGNYSNWEVEITRKDGGKKTVAWSSIAAHIPLPQWTGWGVGIDVSERKRHERILELYAEVGELLSSSLNYEEGLRSLAHLVAPGFSDWCSVYLTESDGTPRLVEVAGVDPEHEALVEDLKRRVEVDPQANTGVIEVIRTGEARFVPAYEEVRLEESVSDEQYLALLRALNIGSVILLPLLANGRVLGVINLVTVRPRRFTDDDLAVSQDLARRASTLIENMRLYTDAQRAIQSRDEFLAVAAHELKTPLTSLRGFAQVSLRQIAREGAIDTERAKRAFQAIEEQSERLAQLISHLRDLSRIEAGRLVLEPKLTDIVSLAESVAITLSAGPKEPEITVNATKTAIATVDALRLRQVLTNLLGGAVETTAPGQPILMDIATLANDDVRLTISYQGSDVTAESLQRLFDKFYKARSGGGMDLGLYLSRRLIEMQGGQIAAELLPESGLRFMITLPHEQKP
jgi:PAS domain S-box-containing protein